MEHKVWPLLDPLGFHYLSIYRGHLLIGPAQRLASFCFWMKPVSRASASRSGSTNSSVTSFLGDAVRGTVTFKPPSPESFGSPNTVRLVLGPPPIKDHCHLSCYFVSPFPVSSPESIPNNNRIGHGGDSPVKSTSVCGLTFICTHILRCAFTYIWIH